MSDGYRYPEGDGLQCLSAARYEGIHMPDQDDYKNLIRKKDARLTDCRVEFAVLNRWDDCSEALRDCRLSKFEHRKRCITEWAGSEVRWHSWSDKMLQDFCDLTDIESGQKTRNWLGSQNSGKS